MYTVLVAGDEDYARTVYRLRREIGFPVHVAFFEDLCSGRLQGAAASLINMNLHHELAGNQK